MVSIRFTDRRLETFLTDERFTRIFERPADPAVGHAEAIRISYADYGYRNQSQPELENVFLFFGPLLGSRMLHVSKDALAKEHRVRFINIDRPGFGDTPDVAPEQRLSFFRDATLALLQYLKIQHVSIGAQSGGTIYALDFLLHHPRMLHPERPYLAIGAPWIHPSHSRLWSMALAGSLPKILLRQTDKLASFFTIVSAPMIQGGFTLATNLSSLWSQPREEGPTSPDPAVAFAEALDPKVADFMFARPVHGMSNEAVLFMQRADGAAGWGDWGDYDALMPRLRQVLMENNRRLVVELFLSETDSMIGDPGTIGPEWFKHCWESDNENALIGFSCRVVAGADHNSIWATAYGVARDVFRHIGGTCAP